MANSEQVSFDANARAWQRTVELVRARWEDLSEDPGHLLLTVKSLPGEAFLRHPWLLAAATHLETELAREPDILAQARPLANRSPHHSDGDLFTHLRTLTDHAIRSLNRLHLQRAVLIIDRALAILSSSDPRLVERSDEPLAALRCEWAAALFFAADPRAADEFEESYRLARATRQSAVAKRAAAGASWMHAEFGRTDIARRWITRARAEDADIGQDGAALCLAEALLCTDRDDLPAARALLDEADRIGLIDYWAAGMWVRSLHAHDVAEAAITESRLSVHLERHPGVRESRGASGRLARAARVRVLLLRGRIPENLRSLARLTPSDQVIAAAVAQFSGDSRAALDMSEPLTEAGVEPRLQANALLVHAAAASALGYADTSRHAFDRADALIQHANMHTSYEALPPSDLELLVRLSGGQERPAVRIGSARRDLPQLTKRENDVLALLTTELKMAEIAATLFISGNTLKTMSRRLYRKLDVANRTEAVDFARRAGFPVHRSRTSSTP